MYLGIDIGGTNTKLGIADGAGNLVLEASFRTTAYAGAPQFLKALDGEIHRMLTLHPGRLAGVGIGAPSANYKSGKIENAANLGWNGDLDIKAHLEASLGCTVLVTNDANLPAIGEMTYGAAQGIRNFITVSLGTGLGCGVVCNGQLVGGHHGMAGELGHALVDGNERKCGCGRKGCLETYASATGIRRTAFELLSKHNGGYSELADFSFAKITAESITQAALEGDEVAIQAFEITGEVLGKKLVDVLCLIDPEAIFLVGGLAQAGELLLAPTRTALNKHRLNHNNYDIPIKSSVIPLDRLSLLGACGLISSYNQSSAAHEKYRTI